MNIVCVEPLGISEARFEELRHEFAAAGHQFNYFLDRNESEEALISRMKDSEIAIISNIKLPASVLTACSKLRMLSVAFTGLDHIDLAYCQQHHITVKNAAGYSTVAVSELAIGLMLDVMRRITALDASTRKGGTRNNFLGRELHGKTVGVVGTGAIGSATIRLLSAFGCHVLAYNRSKHTDVEQMGARYTSLDELLRQSDIVTLHVPLNAETHHLIDASKLAMMKPTAMLINTARGNVVDIDALAKALQKGQLAGAGIDVYEGEPPLPQNHPLLQSPNCVLVPHIGYATREAFDIRANIVIDNVIQYLNGKTK